MFGRERGISGAKKIYDNRNDIIIKINCFFCEEEFELSVRYGYLIKRVFCSKKECQKEHNSMNPEKYRKYTEYREKIRKRVIDKKVITLFYIKGGKLFRRCPDVDLDLGKVVGRDKNFVYAQKMPLDSILHYKKECVREEDAGK